MQRPLAPELRLHRRARISPLRALAYRALLVLGLIGLVIGVHWFDRSGLRDNIDGQISFVDILYFTMITITTVGYGDIVPVTPAARLFDTFVVTPIRLFVWIIFLGTAYDFVLRRIWDRWRMRIIQARLSGHVVIAGYGTSGEQAFAELRAAGRATREVVVVDADEARLEHARECGATVLHGDATRDQVMHAVQIGRVGGLIVTAGRDDTAILIVLTARKLAPRIPISVVIKSRDNESLAHQAGADTVINPAALAGLLLGNSLPSGRVADTLADLAGVGGKVALRERPAGLDDLGKPLALLQTGQGVRLYREGRMLCFADPEAQAITEGDIIVEIVAAGRGVSVGTS